MQKHLVIARSYMPTDNFIGKVRGIRMVDTVDVHDLPDEDVEFLQEIAELLRKRAKAKEPLIPSTINSGWYMCCS